MERETVSNHFQCQIGDHRIVAALFTTYNFEPEFFEQEIIPLIFGNDVALSSDARIKALQIREMLNENPLPIEVFYDRDIFWYESRERRSPAMEYRHHGIRGDRGAFHAKLIFLLLEDDDGVQYLKVAAGSANLTNAGWWENVEAQHWETVVSGEVQSDFLKTLKNDVDWLAEKVGLAPESALEKISKFVHDCRGAASTYNGDPIYYYGLTGVEEYRLERGIREPFLNFLVWANKRAHKKPGGWSMEIISPYFADNDDFSPEATLLDKLEVVNIRLFLPCNDQGEALCRPEYYDKMCDEGSVSWASWSERHSQKLGLKNHTHRTTHAKIFHFYKSRQSWAFIGSVNFTYRAFCDNQEAGFFVKLPHQEQFLEEIDDEPDQWADLTEESAEASSDVVISAPSIEFTYDWKAQALSVYWAKREDGKSGGSVDISIIDPERSPVAKAERVGKHPSRVSVAPNDIEGLLLDSGFLMVAGHYNPGKQVFPEHAVMVQQLNWTHKPLNIPNLTPQEILKIYASLSDVRRTEIIERLKSKQLVAHGLAGEFTLQPKGPTVEREFFAEYAELFHAFRKLREKLWGYYTSEPRDGRRLDYYLSGQSPDSLPILYDSLFDPEASLDTVTIYLALLCLVDIYRQPGFSSRAKVEENIHRCCEKIREIETSGKLNLIEGDPQRTQRFFDWYKKQFFRAYTPVGQEKEHETG